MMVGPMVDRMAEMMAGRLFDEMVALLVGM